MHHRGGLPDIDLRPDARDAVAPAHAKHDASLCTKILVFRIARARWRDVGSALA